jgi:hypothetical protein
MNQLNQRKPKLSVLDIQWSQAFGSLGILARFLSPEPGKVGPTRVNATGLAGWLKPLPYRVRARSSPQWPVGGQGGCFQS